MIGNKKAQGLSTNAIILIILGVIVLAVLILGFSLGWNKFLPFLSQNNVNDIVTACNTACATNSLYDFCSSPRTLTADSIEVEGVTCFYLAENKTEFGVAECNTLSCSNSVLLDEKLSENRFATQADFDDSVGGDKDLGLCAANQGKTLYTLSTDEKTLLSVTCASA